MSFGDEPWTIGPDGCVICQPPDQAEPPKLVMVYGSGSVTVMPPTNRDGLPDFRRFLRDLARAADDLRLMCHPAGEWGRRLLSDAAGGD